MGDQAPNPAPQPEEDRPRERMYRYVQNRMRSIQARETVEGDKMLQGWRDEYRVMGDFKNLLDWLERDELEKVAAADKERKGRR